MKPVSWRPRAVVLVASVVFTACGVSNTSSDAACTTGTYWTGGNRGSDSMNPGLACIACHSTDSRAPRFTVAGTAFAALAEANLCNGQSGLTIEITDATGTTTTLTTNSVGNFSTTAAIVFPIHARVRSAAGVSEMIAAQTSGDCNSCHTESGASGAPGRIAAP